MSRAIRVKDDVLYELEKLYPGLSPHQAIRNILGLSATERKARRRKSRIRNVIDAIFK